MPNMNGHGSNETMERIALYLRVSSEEQVERMSIGTQEEFLEQFGDLYRLDVVIINRDDGISGAVPMHERPAGGQLLKDAAAGEFDVVLVYKLDRIGRTLVGVVDTHDQLSTAGVALRSATEPIDTSTPSGRLIFHMLASFAEFERGTIRERTTHGLHRAYRSGKQSGIIPYGYDVNEDGHLLLVEEEAEIVRTVFSNVAEGSTLYGEAARLNALGIAGPGRKYGGEPRRHSEKWTVATLSKLIHRSIYGGTRRIKINSGADVIEGECPAVVEPELQEKATSRLAENKRFNRRAGDRRYLLAGLITCEVCGSACVGHPSKARGKPRYYYVCGDSRPERRRRAEKGHAPYVRAEWLEEMVWADVRHFLKNPGEVLERIKEQTTADEETGALEHRRGDLQKRLQGTHAEYDRYMKLYGKGEFDQARLKELLRDVEVRAELLRMLLNSVEAQLSERLQQRQVAETTAAWLATLRDRVSEVEGNTEEAFSARRELVRLLVESIITGRDEQGKVRVEITSRFGERPPDPNGQDLHVGSVSNPQGWADPVSRKDADAFAAGISQLGVSPVVAHAKYLINLASTNDEQRNLSVRALARELVAASALGVDLVVVHAGSHGGDGEKEGMDRLVDGLERASEQAAGFDGAAGAVAEPVVENSVGVGTQLCSSFDSLGEVARRAGVRVCVDTAHAFVAGYDLSSADGGRMAAAELADAVGDVVALLHLNDAKNELGSHRDGHRKVGKGRISVDAWPELFKGLPGVPVVMETPYETPAADAEEVRLVKKLAGGLRKAPFGR